MIKRLVHAAAVGVARPASKLLPDRVPVTFVGATAIAEFAGALGARGLGRVLVVTDQTLIDLGIVDKVTDALAAVGVESAVYGGIAPDPTKAQVEAGHTTYHRERCGAVVAVGGGSPIDAAKMIAAMATNGGDLDKLEGKLRVRKAPAPLFAIPTTAGTGSEVTIAAVISDTDTHQKKFFLDPKLLPNMAVLDPTLMLGLPPAITAATGMDALTHAIESYISKTSNPQTEAYATTAVKLIFDNLGSAHRDGGNVEARKNMALASYYAGLAFTRTSVGYVHAIAHNLGAVYGTPHGLANAITLPHVLDYSLEQASSQLAALGALIGLDGDEHARSRAFIDAVRELMRSIDIPETLEALQPADIEDLARRALAEAFLDYPVPRFMDQDECEAVIRKLLAPPVAAS